VESADLKGVASSPMMP
jgi:hypothetical protein